MRDYEIRCYAPTTWVYTKAGNRGSFMKLFRYIHGANAAKKKIPMTVPVSTTMVWNPKTRKAKSVMSFYIPTKKNQTAPAPTDKDVSLFNQKKKCVFVRSFGGYVKGPSRAVFRQLMALSRSLKRDKMPYIKFVSNLAGYNSPWQLFWRHNEVMRAVHKNKTDEIFKLVTLEEEALTVPLSEKVETPEEPKEKNEKIEEEQILETEKEKPTERKEPTEEKEYEVENPNVQSTKKRWFGQKGGRFGLIKKLLSGGTRRHHHRRRKPRFCGRRSCPRFITVARKWGYDVRCYWYSTWAVTAADKVDQKQFKDEFRRLYNYIRGSNMDHKKMAMTVPVLTRMKYNITDHKTTSGLGFYVPTRCNHTAPAPTDTKVKIMKLPKFCAYVRSFSGYTMGRTKLMYQNLFRLSKALKRDGKSYQPGLSMFAGYNSPMQLLFRHNEVWRMPQRKEELEYLDMASIKDEGFNEVCPSTEALQEVW